MRSRPPAVPFVLTLIASACALLAVFALWANRQFLNTDAWTDTSSEILAQPAVKNQVAGFLVDQLYANVDVQGQLREALPPQAAPLAGPAAGGLRQLAERAAQELLGRPRAQAAWEGANRRAHKRLLQVLDGGGDTVSTENGVVTLDLKSLLGQTESRVGIGGRIQGKLPADAAQVTIMRSDQLGLAQDIVQVLKALPYVLLALTLLLYAGAVYFARGRRREALRACGFGLVAAGVLALLLRSYAGDTVVDSLAKTEAVKPAAAVTWDLSTSLLVQAATASIFYGAFLVLGAFLAGPTSAASWVRRHLAPFVREPSHAYGVFGAFVLLLLVWGPTPALRKASTILILIALLAVGFEVLRRLIAREFPDARMEDVTRAIREGLRSFGGRARGASHRAPAAPDGPDRFAELERLGALRDSGILSLEEFEGEKRKVLNGSTAAGAT